MEREPDSGFIVAEYEPENRYVGEPDARCLRAATAIDMCQFMSHCMEPVETKRKENTRRGASMRIGYARVSSVGQSLDVQLDKLSDCDKVFREKRSATSAKREQLELCLDFVREGDTLVVTRLDRLARSTLHLCQLAKTLDRKQVNLQVLEQNINTSDATGRLLFNMLGAIGQFENEIRLERQKGWH